MAERVPPIAPVKARGAFASHPGARRPHDDARVAFETDGGAAFALAVRGLANARWGRPAGHRVADLVLRIFRERTASMLDDLAEVWWRAEHGADEGARVRPFTSLPIVDRAELRSRVRKLLAERVPDTLGDQAVLAGETKRLLDLPSVALRRASNDLERMAEKDRQWVQAAAAAEAIIFAAGHASLAHVGDGRVVRLRRGKLEALTRPHTLRQPYEDEAPADEPRPPPSHIPPGVIVRFLGGNAEVSRADTAMIPLERRDLFLLLTAGLAATLDDDALRAALLAHGVEAAPRLVAEAAPHAEDNVAAVAVEIL